MHRAIFSLLLLCVVQLSAQQTPSTTITSSSELVSVPVVVRDKAGHPVRGMTKDDFVIYENGKTQRPIASFEFVETTPNSSIPAPRVAGGEYSNFAGSNDHPVRLTIIVLDMINTPFTSQARVKSELLKFLAGNVRGDEPTALLTIGRSGVRQIHPFTSNPKLLIAALGKVTGRQSNMEVQSIPQENPIDPDSLTLEEQRIQEFQRDNEAMVNAFFQKNAIRDTMASLEQIAQAYAGLPGRKTLIWASSGFPFLLEDPQSLLGFGTETLSDYERAWRALNAANIAVYPVDAEGLLNPADRYFNASQRNAPFPVRGPRMGQRPPYDSYQQTRDMMRSFADATGGKACLDRNDLATCFELAARDSDSYYILSYYLPEQDRKPGWHKLKVTVDRKDVNIRARSGFFVPDRSKSALESKKAELTNAFSSPLDYTGMQLAFRWASKRPDPKDANKSLATFEVAMPAASVVIDPGDNNHINLEIAAVAFDEKFKVVGDVSKTIDGRLKPENADKIRHEGLRYRDDIPLPKGKYTVKVVIRDNLAGKIGSVSVPVTVN